MIVRWGRQFVWGSWHKTWISSKTMEPFYTKCFYTCKRTKIRWREIYIWQRKLRNKLGAGNKKVFGNLTTYLYST